MLFHSNKHAKIENTMHHIQKLSVTLFVLLLAIFSVPQMSHAATTVVGGTDVTLSPFENVTISDWQIESDSVDDITVHVFVTADGTVYFPETTGITFLNDIDESDSVYLTGSVEDINTALASMVFYSQGLTDTTIEMTIVNRPGQVYYPGNGHMYEFQYSPNITGAQALIAAALLNDGSSDEIPGYLGTITSSEENAYISSRVDGDGWIGASDAASEGDWKWLSGPETGTSFWSGDAFGSVVSDEYANWNGGEPNDSGGNEDCAQYYSETGRWNDVFCGGELDWYVVEFGTDGDVPTVVFDSLEVTIQIDTVEIDSCEELQALNDDMFEYVYDEIVLTADIDCYGVEMYPLFDIEGGFRGTFDGQDHTISNIEISDAASYSAGLFAYLDDGGVIRDVVLESGSVSGTSNVGGLVGSFYGGTIDNVCSSVSVTGEDNVGGLVGYLGETTLLQNSCANADVVGENNVGGLAGFSDDDDVEISESYFNGSVEGDSGVGGLLGYDDEDVYIQDSYAIADIQGVDTCGGLLGHGQDNEIAYSYFSGTVTCTETEAGGLLGEYGDSYYIYDSFWDLLDGLGPVDSEGSFEGATGARSTEAMKDIATYTEDEDLNESWDFETVWDIDALINNGYPFLRNVRVDFTAPTIESLSPAANATDVPTDTEIVITFSEEMDPDSLIVSSAPCGNECPSFDENWSDGNTVLTLTLEGGDFDADTTYTIDIDRAEDAEGNNLEAGYAFSFTTEASQRRSSGSVKNRVKNLLDMGKTTEAEEVVQQFPNAFTPAAGTTSPVAITELFARNLQLGMQGEDVNRLQRFLIEQNKGQAARDLNIHGTTLYFGVLTRNALIEFQRAVNIAPAIGFFGPITRGYVNNM